MTTTRTVAPFLYARDGKRKTQFFTMLAGKYHPLGHDEGQAKIKLAVLMELPAVETTIRAMCDGYLRDQERRRDAGEPGAITENGQKDYTVCLKTVCAVFGDMAPGDFKPSHAARYLKLRREQGCGVRGNKEMSALSSAFNYGMESGAVEVNPCRGYRRNTETPRTRKVEVAEVNAFLRFAELQGGSAYLTALIGLCVALTGRRRGEVLRLPKASITAEGLKVPANKVRAGETQRHYLVEWSPTLRQLVDLASNFKHRRAKNRPALVTGFLFHNRDGAPYTDSGFKTNWQKLMRAYAGTPDDPRWFRNHDLRALYVSEMLAQERAPNTHKNEKTMRAVYDRRRVVKVSPLA